MLCFMGCVFRVYKIVKARDMGKRERKTDQIQRVNDRSVSRFVNASRRAFVAANLSITWSTVGQVAYT